MTNNTKTFNKVTSSMLTRMEDKILPHRPRLKKIKETFGSFSYFDYVKQKTRVNLNKTYVERKPEVIGVIKSETTRLLGSSVAAEVEKQLKKNDSVSTAEHAGSLGTSNMLNAALHHAAPQFGNSDPRFRNSIVLSCSGVSFGNASSFTRGFTFHPTLDETPENTLTFFGRSSDAETVMFASPYTIDSVGEMRKKLETLQREGQLSGDKRNKIDTLLTEVFSSPHALSGSDYTDQLSITNYYLWKRLFPSFREDQVPNYVMLSQEKIVLELLLKNHLDQDTPIHKFLFDNTYLDLVQKNFADVTGAHSSEELWGTFLFWGISQDNHMRFNLFREGDKLINKDRTYSLPLTPDAIRNAINEKTIYPGLLLTFTVLCFYYGLIPGGGHLQTSYLTEMKQRYIKMMNEVNDTASAEQVGQSITDDFVFYRPHLTFLDIPNDRIPATGIDMYLYQGTADWKNILSATKSITVNEFMTLLLPIFYKQVCPPEEREEDLMKISPRDVAHFTGFENKIPSLNANK